MLFGKKTNLVGLDIGSRTIKAGEIAETKKGRMLKKFGTIDLPIGVIEDGTIKDPDTAAELIRQLFRNLSIRNQNVAISIGGYSVIVKKINVQKMDEDKLQESIHLEAEQYIPFDISDVNIDFQILGEADGNPNQMNVLLVAAKKEMVTDYVNLVQLAGLNPCLIDVDAFALQNIFELNYDLEDGNVALIDIGASKTSLNILKNSTSVFMRDVSLGCGQINQRIASQTDCSLEAAEQLKFTDQPDGISREELNGIITSVITDWCTEIRRALDFFYSTYPDDQIRRIALSGGGANIKEFRDLLADEASTEVEIIQPFNCFEMDSGKLDLAYLEKNAPQAAICMGLSIRRMDDK